MTRRARAACTAVLLGLATTAAYDASGQPMPMRPARGVPRGSTAPAPTTARPTPAVETPTEDLRGRFGVDMAVRLMRSADPDERLRGIERATATRTPEGLSLLERASGTGVAGGLDPRASIDAVARQDSRALLAVVRGLASWVDREPARVALEALLRESSQAFVVRTASTGKDPAADEADNIGRVALARREAAMALAASGSAMALDALLATARSNGTPGQMAALDALALHPPSTPLLGGVALTTPAMIGLAAEVGDLRSLGAILGAVHTSDPAVRAAAVAALGLSGDARALDVAREAAKDKDPRVRVAGADALAHLGAADAGPAIEALVADDLTARDGLRIAAGVIAEGVTKAAAARAAASVDPELRALAVAVLGRQTSPAAVTALVALAADPHLAGDVMDALARSPCPAAMAAIDAMGAAPANRRLAARGYFVRRSVRGERSARGDALLAALAASGDGADRALGVEALVALRERPLAAGLGDRDPRVRRAAALGSLALGDARAIAETLTAHLVVETDETTRQALALGLVDGDPRGLVPTTTLIDRAQAGGPDAPLAALALARRADDELAPKVDALLASRDPVIRAHVARGLASSKAPDAVGRMARAYAWEPVAEVRRALVAALAARPAEEHASPSWREALELAAHLDPDRVTQAVAQRALAGRAPARPPAGTEVAWLRVVAAEGASRPKELGGTLIDASGAALPFVFDDDGYALVPGQSPGDARLRLAPRLPAYESR